MYLVRGVAAGTTLTGTLYGPGERPPTFAELLRTQFARLGVPEDEVEVRVERVRGDRPE